MRVRDIVAILEREAALAAERGWDNLGWYVTPQGDLVDRPINEGWLAEAYWDSQDPSNEGWAYRITPVREGRLLMNRQESGPLF